MHDGMDPSNIISATYANRWIGSFMQTHGKNVLPTVGWVKPDTYRICFAGLRNGGTFIISTLGVNNVVSKPDFMSGYYYMREHFPDSKIICLGCKVDEMDSDICYVPYKNSFGNWEKYPGYWQPTLWNWDGTPIGGDE